ncbi:helix-turn-helix domain-containing protein [Paenibacillus sp. yr247]|uniref:helix-turn-helix domain-containing protein n=1 Tax=Paenibacillus sp. yr247 TaxID=1761880 RepID=UPI001587CD55|nr:helix-turn-helix transcriptional regulator [Paenibacillus sp. yr247]
MVKQDVIYEEIGKRIREAREVKKWTQEELGKLVDLTRTSITNIERGKQKIQIDGLYNFADILGVSVFSLLPHESVLLNNIELPGNEERLNEVEPEVIDFAKKVYANYKRNEGEK